MKKKKKKKKKKAPGYHHFTCVQKIMIRLYMAPELWCVADGQTDGKSDI